ncbi:MAG: MBL fold metallo-hydrolase [Microscillaceae bacterium]|nr:MBL fold metallo-hydrolase [Microscillaceae bacterium]MDW8460816.1 MBL fold metallo-hydrolase [Cytophagales bacterium]
MIKIYILDLQFQQKDNAIAAFLVKHENAYILVETGPYSSFAQLTKEVERCGIHLSDIRHVFITHIHLDHAGASWALAEQGATIYLHPFGYAHMANPEKLIDSARRIYKEQMDTLWGDMKPVAPERLRTVAHEEIIEIGNLKIKALHTPGHANHHIAWQVDEVIFTGDVAGVKIMDGPVVAPCPPPDIDIEKWLKSIELLRRANAKTFYLTHFGKVENIETHLNELQYSLEQQAHWIKSVMQSGQSIAEITQKFDAWAVEQLKNMGLSSSQVVSYQLANPAWMSVAGLMRYWEKKMKAV